MGSNSLRVLVAGCGYVGAVLAERLAADGYVVYGLRRRASAIAAPVQPIRADLLDPASLGGLPEVDVLIFAASPSTSGEEAYRATYVRGLENLLAAARPKARVLFTSSTAVYGQEDGSVVDESSETAPTSYRGRVLLEAEALVTALEGGTVLRLAGIYGPGRARLLERVRAGAAEYVPGEVSNRIHRDDAAGALRHLVGLEVPDKIYLGVDSEPAEKESLLSFLAERTGSPMPRRASSPGWTRGNKRCSNRRLLASGYRLLYPTFREGFESLLEGG